MKQTYSSSSSAETEEPLQTYSSYKEEQFSKLINAQQAINRNVTSGSLRLEDKRLLLVRMRAQIDEALVLVE